MASEIAILNADHFMGATGFSHLHEKKSTGMQKDKTAPQRRPKENEDGPRKRARRSAAGSLPSKTPSVDVHENGEEESTKRTRGRPRLDTTGQTAADRRRAQIRLAQRAYRSRKENAIQSLEKKVQGLQETNEEIGNAFMKLHDYAMTHGILDLAPGFAQQLRSTTERILALVRRLDDDDGSDDDDDDQIGSVQDPAAPHVSSSQEQDDTSPSSEVVERTLQSKSAPYSHVLGYNFSTESGMMPPFATTNTPTAITASSIATTPKSVYYGDVNMSFFDHNASFPDSVTTDANMFPDPTTASLTSPSEFDFTSSSGSPFPYCPLPLPRTYSFHEATLTRRLARISLERGYRLITMPNPPKTQFAQSFGFSLLFEPVERIRERLRIALARSRNESLGNWQAPFWALGGAGQHGDSSPFLLQSPVGPSPNGVDAGGTVTYQPPQQEDLTVAAGKHNLGTHRRFGPFDVRTSVVEATKLDARMRMLMPGFEGDFFDAGEVEQYLRVRGVVVPPGQNYVTVELDVALFEGGQTLTGEAGKEKDAKHRGTRHSSASPEFGSSFSTLPVVEDESVPLQARTRSKEVVTIDISVFLSEVARRAVCLGRTAGYRPKDVNNAFWRAIRKENSVNFQQ